MKSASGYVPQVHYPVEWLRAGAFTRKYPCNPITDLPLFSLVISDRLKPFCEVGAVIISILRMRKLRFSEIKQVYTACAKYSLARDSEAGGLILGRTTH